MGCSYIHYKHYLCNQFIFIEFLKTFLFLHTISVTFSVENIRTLDYMLNLYFKSFINKMFYKINLNI